VNDVLVAREQVRYEQKAYWRNPMAAFFTFMFPVVFLVVVGSSAGSFRVPGTTLRYNQYVVVAMLVFGLIGACYTNLAMTICLRRDNGMPSSWSESGWSSTTSISPITWRPRS